jgi:hypothetical protein
MTAAQLAEATHAHELSLYRVLRLLASLGVVTEGEDRSFGLTVLGDRLRADAPASMRSWAMLTDSIGGVRSFQAAVSERTAAFAPSVAAEYDFSAAEAVADIGGGKGTLLAAILQEHGHLRGVLFDRPEVASESAGVLAAAGVANRCEVVAGDFFAGVPGGAYVYVPANVLHDWDDARSVQILANCRKVMAASSRCSAAGPARPDRRLRGTGRAEVCRHGLMGREQYGCRALTAVRYRAD